MSLIYTQYMTDYKISNENKIEFQEYLIQNGIIDENGKVDTSKLCGTKQFLGNGTDKDIYTFKNSKKQYVFEYVEDDGTTKEILKIAKDTSEGIDYTELEPGLYKTGTNQMIKTWSEIYTYYGCSGQAKISDDAPEGDVVVPDFVTQIFCYNSNITRIIILGNTLIYHISSDKLTEIICIGNAYMDKSTGGIRDLNDECPNLKSISMTQQCYKKENWTEVEKELNSNIKINIKNYYTNVERFAEKLPKDPAEKEKVLTDIFIKGVNFKGIINKKIDVSTRFTTLQDAWNYIKANYQNSDYREFDTLTQYINAVYIGNYENFYSDLLTYKYTALKYNDLTASYIIDILNDLPTDEMERWNDLTEVYIKAKELEYKKEFTTLQEVWEYMKLEKSKDYTKYTTLKDWFETEIKDSYYSSIEYYLLWQPYASESYWICQAEQKAEEEWFN